MVISCALSRLPGGMWQIVTLSLLSGSTSLGPASGGVTASTVTTVTSELPCPSLTELGERIRTDEATGRCIDERSIRTQR